MANDASSAKFTVSRMRGGDIFTAEDDVLAVEEPLEIRLGFDENGSFTHRAVSITMRTPGDDFELAVGFLFTEGIVKSPAEVKRVIHCGTLKTSATNTVRVDLQPEAAVNLKRLERHFYTTSSCGVCGKSSIEVLSTGAKKLSKVEGFALEADVVHSLPVKARAAQDVFESTGGLHAAALFNLDGELELLREDVGRHNAVDKLIGAKFLEGKLPLSNNILFVSGRASFELVQKAAMAQIPVMAAVGAPSSLAVELAKEFNMTLLGFVRDNRFNIYAGEQRIISTQRR